MVFFTWCMSIAQDFDFRKIRWEMNIDEVKKAETAEYVKSNGEKLFYFTEIDDDLYILTYNFKDGKLWSAAYEFINKDREKCIEIYKKFRKKLINELGDPKGENDYIVKWEGIRTDVGLYLTKEDKDNKIIIAYISKSKCSIN